MKFRLAAACLAAACLVAALAVACSPSTPDATKSAGGPAAKRMPLPNCAEVEVTDAGADGWKHPDCRTMLTDASKLALEVRFKPAADDTTKVAVQVVVPGDATKQTIEETLSNTIAGVELGDFDADGRQDIQVPLETGNVNTTWALWRQSEDGRFIRLGEVSGVEIKHTESGYLSVAARSSANEWGVSFYKLDGDAMNPIVTTDVIARGEPDKITGVDCVLTDDGGLPSTGLDAKAAEKKFCAEPSVVEIFK